MIDTIRFRIPADEYNEKVLQLLSCQILTLSPDGRELRKYNKFMAYDEINSQFQHIYISQIGSFIYFEFSLHKFINRYLLNINYNHNNYSLTTDYCFFIRFIQMINRNGFDVKLNYIEVMRVDVGLNYRLHGIDVLDFFELLYLQMGKFSKIKTNQFRTSCYYPSRWVTKKFYSKYYDLKNICSKGHLSKKDNVIQDLFEDVKNIVRLEFSIKKQKLNQMGFGGKFCFDMLYKVKEYFEGESMEILKFQKYFKKRNDNNFTFQEQFFIQQVLEFGYNYAKNMLIQEHSRRTFYRVQKRLKEKGVNLKSLTKSEERVSLQELDINKLEDIKLEVV